VPLPVNLPRQALVLDQRLAVGLPPVSEHRRLRRLALPRVAAPQSALRRRRRPVRRLVSERRPQRERPQPPPLVRRPALVMRPASGLRLPQRPERQQVRELPQAPMLLFPRLPFWSAGAVQGRGHGSDTAVAVRRSRALVRKQLGNSSLSAMASRGWLSRPKHKPPSRSVGLATLRRTCRPSLRMRSGNQMSGLMRKSHSFLPRLREKDPN
jgi:hypothetical protein